MSTDRNDRRYTAAKAIALKNMQHHQTFVLSARLNWNRNHAPVPASLLRLKKPILPDRWYGFRDGWGKLTIGDEALIRDLKRLRMMTDEMAEEIIRRRPSPDARLYFDDKRLVVGWRIPEGEA